jgi:hypothetical protein
MRIKTIISAGLGLMMLGAVPAMASDAKVYPYASSQNYCPAGLQPVTLSGVICCGTPNQSVSYQSMMAHPVRRQRAPRRVSYDCPAGVKGCS